MSKHTIGQKLRQLREASGYNAKEVSLILQKNFSLNVQYKSIYNYENGRNSPDTDIFLALCIIYNCEDILFEFGYTDTPKKYPISSEVSELYSKYRALPKDGQTVIRNALGMSPDNTLNTDPDVYIPDTPEELEALYPPIESPDKKKNIS